MEKSSCNDSGRTRSFLDVASIMRSQSDRDHSFNSDGSWSLLLTPAVQGGHHAGLAINGKHESTIRKSIGLYESMVRMTVSAVCGVAPMNSEHLAKRRQNGLALFLEFAKLRSYASIYRPPNGNHSWA